MLAPKKVKFRRCERPDDNKAIVGSDYSGEFGLKALEPGWVTSRQKGRAYRDYPIREAGGQV